MSSIPHLKPDDKRIVFTSTSSVGSRFFFFFILAAVVGGGIYWLQLSSVLSGLPPVDRLLPLTFILLTLIVVIAMLLRIDDFTVDFVNRCYRHRHGIFPFVKVEQGPCTDIKHILIEYYYGRISSGGHDSSSTPYMQMQVWLVWQQDDRPRRLIFEPKELHAVKTSMRRMLGICSKLSQALNVPILDKINGERIIAPGQPYPQEGAATARPFSWIIEQ
jgi:hypothetical protein